MRFTGATLRMIIRSAFGIDLVEGGPSWIGADEFEMNEEAPAFCLVVGPGNRSRGEVVLGAISQPCI